MPAPHRVVVTGMGVISALGLHTGEFWDSLKAGRSGIGPMQNPLAYAEVSPLRIHNFAEVHGFAPETLLDTREISLMDRFAQFAVVSAHEAIQQAAIEWTEELKARTAVITGSCMSGRGIEEAGYWELFHNSRSRVHPLTIPTSMANAGTSHICMRFGLQGPSWTVSTACSSANHAIGQAMHLIRSGAAPVVIAGGSEAPLFLGGLKAWEAMRVVSKDTCRPFSADRSGLILGEGGAMLVLESLEGAQARGAKILAELAGFGASADAGHITQPAVTGPARAMSEAMRDAGLAPEQVQYINAHGTATEINDKIETCAIQEVFGALASKVAVSSTKSMHGHTLGAAGALEAAATVLALQHGILPPTANYTQPDPQCNLDVVPNVAREVQIEAALSNSFAFGGLNAVLAFKAWV